MSTKAVFGMRNLNSYLGLKLRVTVWIPEQTEHGDFECKYRITGAGDEKVRRSVGIDEIQAAMLALRKIGSDIAILEETLSTKFFIGSGETSPSHGFPEIESSQEAQRGSLSGESR